MNNKNEEIHSQPITEGEDFIARLKSRNNDSLASISTQPAPIKRDQALMLWRAYSYLLSLDDYQANFTEIPSVGNTD